VELEASVILLQISRIPCSVVQATSTAICRGEISHNLNLVAFGSRLAVRRTEVDTRLPVAIDLHIGSELKVAKLCVVTEVAAGPAIVQSIANDYSINDGPQALVAVGFPAIKRFAVAEVDLFNRTISRRCLSICR
jgi:hypothetical protein